MVPAELMLPPIPRVMNAVLEGLVLGNLEYLKDHPGTPQLMAAGVVYEFRPPGKQWWFIPDVLANRKGDCKDLSAFACAELRFYGVDPGAHVVTYQTAHDTFHAIVARTRPWLFFEDPSRALGMP